MLKNIQTKNEFTFDDILLIPNKSEYEMAEENKIDLSTHLTKELSLKVPIVSANMSTVTESQMAIKIAELGGIGIIHQFMDEERQILEVKKVKDKNLMVGAAVFSYGKTIYNQVKKLAKAGCDVVVIDSANAHNLYVLNLVRKIKKDIKIQLIVGNVVTKEAVSDLAKAGADGIKIGIGPGSHCTTRIVTGFGRPQLSTIIECAKAAQKYGVPIIADGGINFSGDAVKALALGANSVMIGGLLAGTKESPGEIINKDGNLYKHTWGNCTKEAYGWLEVHKNIYNNIKIFIKKIIRKDNVYSDPFVEEGVDGIVEYKGESTRIINQIIGGIRRGYWYGGAKNIKTLQKKSNYVLVSSSSLTEAGPRITFK